MLTYNLLAQIYPRASKKNVIKFVDDYNRFRWLHAFENLKDLAAFLANVGHETNQLLWTEELASGSDYEGRADLGNTSEGFGKKYKGRGYLQTTGFYNYYKFTQWYNAFFRDKEDFTLTPERLSSDRSLAYLTAIYFWKQRNISKYARVGLFQKSVQLVNGGLNGFEERKEIYKRAILVLSTQA